MSYNKVVNPYDLNALALQRAKDNAKRKGKLEDRESPYTLTAENSLEVQIAFLKNDP